MIARRGRVIPHGMGAFNHAIDRDGKNDYEENPGKIFQVDEFSHKWIQIVADSSETVKDLLNAMPKCLDG